MAMTLTTFINTYLGKKVDWDGVSGCHCVDLYRQYLNDVLEVPQTPALGVEGGAKDIFEKHGVLKAVKDSPATDYSVGDILIWDKTKTNRYGHVAILVGLYNTKYFFVLEQNGFTQDGVKITLRSRENLLGYLCK